MKNIFFMLISFVPIIYFGIKVFAGQQFHYYPYFFCITLIINIFFIAVFRRKTYAQYWIGTLFSFMFLDMVFNKIDIKQFVNTWKGLNFLMIIPAVLFTVFSCILQAYRWRIILSNINAFKFNELFPSVMIGHLANHIMPAKAGEFVKSYHLGKLYGYNKVSIFSTVVIERIFDGIMVLSFLFFFLIGLREVKSELILMGWAGLAIYGGAFLFIYIVFKYTEKIVTLSHSLLPQKISLFFTKIIEAFSEGLHVLSNLKQLFQVMLISVSMWIVIAVSIIPLMIMFEFELPFYVSFAILACISLGMTLPSAPGGIGIISFATIFAMNILFREANILLTDDLYAKVVVFSILINIVMVLPEIILGTFFAIRSGVKIASISDDLSVG
ncbi:MAG: hypothetical protein A2X55_04875 [Nitrospirae bacterium GWB2_47_37]|nr:MAG: hypothetical protein A2X55_04875 [Nitrospirae bacterium GWB2_47_37]